MSLDDNVNYVISDAEAYALNCNAYFHYKEFINSITKDGVGNDGKNILLKEIDKYLFDDENKRFIKTIGIGKKLYRARLISQDNLKKSKGIEVVDEDGSYTTIGFDEGNSREAPLGLSDAGRNNIKGVSYLYLSDRVQTACVEVKPAGGQLISVAEFKTNRKMMIIDFSRNVSFDVEESWKDNIALGTFFTLVMSRYFLPIIDESEYIATQIITDHIRKSGIDGVAYKSFFDISGTNYTIFNSNRNSIEFIGSKLLMHKCVSNTFIDFNNRKVLKTHSMMNNKYDAKISDDICNRIKNSIIDDNNVDSTKSKS